MLRLLLGILTPIPSRHSQEVFATRDDPKQRPFIRPVAPQRRPDSRRPYAFQLLYVRLSSRLAPMPFSGEGVESCRRRSLGHPRIISCRSHVARICRQPLLVVEIPSVLSQV